MTEPKFEDALKKLEKIVEELEGGDLSLDESLAKYEEGIKLSCLCAKKLETAKNKIETLIKTSEGKFALKPFDESGLDSVAIKKGRTKRSKNDDGSSLF
ncbi:MAG: exodeoxyribonuclease VII small subunit [Candidatus Omnitrophota bacterium]